MQKRNSQKEVGNIYLKIKIESKPRDKYLRVTFRKLWEYFFFFWRLFLIWPTLVFLSVLLLQLTLQTHRTTCDTPNMSCCFKILLRMSSIFSSLIIIPRQCLHPRPCWKVYVCKIFSWPLKWKWLTLVIVSLL